MKEEKIQYLQMIQNIITRMASNSASVKNWWIMSMSAIFSLLYTKSTQDCFEALIGVSIVCCFLDARYLSLERAYREKYNMVRTSEDISFDLSHPTPSLSKTLHSWSLSPYYLVLLFSMCYLLITLKQPIVYIIGGCL